MKFLTSLQQVVLVMALCLLFVNSGVAAEGEKFPPIAGKQTSYETNPASHIISYTGTNKAGQCKFVITWVRRGTTTVEHGAYSVTKSGNGWAIAHIFGNQTLTLRFKIIKNLPSGGFVASGNMFDTNGHPSLNVAENFTFIQKK